MGYEENDQESSVNWGKLGKNLLAGAAIVVGACIVFPGLAGALLTGLGALGTSIGGMSIGTVSGEVTSGIGVLLTKAFGVALAAGGASYLLSDHGKHSAPSVEGPVEAPESYIAREDMRKMQAVMLARMQAQGYQPAMALANQPGL